MTLNGRYALYCRKIRLSEPTTKKLNEDIEPYYRQQKCRTMTVVSCNKRFMWIFAGVLWRGGVKRQWGNRKRRFLGLLDATSSALQEMRPTLLYNIILVLCPLSTDPKNVTFNDLDWLFRVKFCFRAGFGWLRPCDFGK